MHTSQITIIYLQIFIPFAVICTLPVSAQDGEDLKVVIICQNNALSQSKCSEKESNLMNEGLQHHQIVVTQRDFSHDGDWTIFPIVSWLNKELSEIPRWILFITEHTNVNILQLKNLITDLDIKKNGFVGFALTDPEPTIIHHFSSNLNFQFPLIPAGILLSNLALTELHKAYENPANYKNTDFSIDASYEFASFMSLIGFSLNHTQNFCVKNDKNCVTWISINSPEESNVQVDEVFFAVKTCQRFHETRVSVVKDTWGSAATNIAFYSDIRDLKVSTISLNVVNTDHGHCAKTRGILSALIKKFNNKPQLKWAVISDDDTILGVAQILKLISQYNSSEEIAIGERYGYNLQDGGYNYLTGGGGVILSRAVIMKFNENDCVCPSPSTPDDMYLFGVCLKRLDVPIIHNPLIHQARPNDYNKNYLSIGKPISFHKHWMLDPRQVYKQWFEAQDSKHPLLHQEL